MYNSKLVSTLGDGRTRPYEGAHDDEPRRFAGASPGSCAPASREYTESMECARLR